MTIQFEYPDGATPISDCTGLKLSWVQTQKDLNRAEAENIIEAQKKFLRKPVENPNNWFEPKVLMKIHKEMLGNVWQWAGQYRRSVTNIGIKPYMVGSQLAELCQEVKFWLTNPIELSFLEQAARIHHKLVFIHPFENGNGRFSRLIADRYLIFWGCEHTHWPVDLQNNGSERLNYLNCLKSADRGNYAPLIAFMEKLGTKDPSLSRFLGLAMYRDNLMNSQRLDIVRAFLRRGYEVNETENNGHHPLHIAIKKGYDDIALLLIQNRADLKFRDRSGYDPFELAISRGNLKLANALYEAGYPYKRGHPTPAKLLNHYAKLYQFEQQLNKKNF